VCVCVCLTSASCNFLMYMIVAGILHYAITFTFT